MSNIILSKNARRKRAVRLRQNRVRAPGKRKKVFERFPKCFYCRKALDEKNRTIDHLVPRSRGGSHAEENLVAACNKCNNLKQDKMWWQITV